MITYGNKINPTIKTDIIKDLNWDLISNGEQSLLVNFQNSRGKSFSTMGNIYGLQKFIFLLKNFNVSFQVAIGRGK